MQLPLIFIYLILLYGFSVGVTLPTIEVRYEHVHIEAEAHVGSRALPSVVNFYISLLEVSHFIFIL